MARSRLRAAVVAGLTALSLAALSAAAGAPAAAAPPTHDEQITFQDWSLPRLAAAAPTRAPSPSPASAPASRCCGRPAPPTTPTRTPASPRAGTTPPGPRRSPRSASTPASWSPRGTPRPRRAPGSRSRCRAPTTPAGRPPGTSWAAGPPATQDIKRTSINRQGDPWSTIWTDTFSIDDVANGVMLHAYQLRLTLYRAPGQWRSPRVWMLGAMSSYVPDRFTVTPSAGGIAWGTELAVPRYSQNIHTGHYPEYDGGGEAWCSPTSTAMVVEYWGRRPVRRGHRLGRPGLPGPARSTTPPGWFTTTVRRRGQLAVQHRVRGVVPGPGRQGDPAALARRGGAVHQGRHPDRDEPVRSCPASWTGPTTAPPGTCSSSSASPPTATSSSTTRRRRPTTWCATSTRVSSSSRSGCVPSGPTRAAVSRAARAASPT